MRTSTRIFDRLLTGVVGLALLAGGGWLLADHYQVAEVSRATDRIAPWIVADLPEQQWWSVTVAAAGVVLVIGAVVLLLRHLRSPAARTVALDGHGSVDLTRVADAASAALASSPLIEKARSRTLVERGRPVVRVSATPTPAASLADLTELVQPTRRSVATATGGQVDFQVLLRPSRDAD